jgi:hypothetical protein
MSRDSLLHFVSLLGIIGAQIRGRRNEHSPQTGYRAWRECACSAVRLIRATAGGLQPRRGVNRSPGNFTSNERSKPWSGCKVTASTLVLGVQQLIDWNNATGGLRKSITICVTRREA